MLRPPKIVGKLKYIYVKPVYIMDTQGKTENFPFMSSCPLYTG